MNIEDYIKTKKAFIVGFDNVLYPEKDYLLQVYYLFSEFITYSELTEAAPIVAFMRSEFEQNGVENIFEKTASHFNIPIKYKENFVLLHETARLPLKLLLYKQMLSLLQELVVERKEIFLLVKGNPAQQINKIKQMEWHGLEKYLKLYFADEFGSEQKCIDFIIVEHNLVPEDILVIGNEEPSEKLLVPKGVDYFVASKLL